MIDRTMRLEGDKIIGVALVADVPNMNGVVIPRETLKKALEEFPLNKLYVSHLPLKVEYAQNLKFVSAIVDDAKIEDDGALKVIASLCDSEKGNILRSLAEDQCHAMSLNVFADIKDDIAHDIQIISISVVHKSKFSRRPK